MSDNENIYAKPINLTPENERVVSVLAHLIGIPFELVGPFIGYLIFKDKGPFVNHHTKESLNFGISMLVIALIMVVSIIGLAFIWALPIYYLVMRIIAAMAAWEGKFYKYPLTIRFIK